MQTLQLNGQTIQCDDKLAEILNGNAEEISVWGDGKHRSAIYDPVRVIANDKTEDTESEILVVTNTNVFRFTIDNTGNLHESHSKIGEIYNEFGKKV